MADKKLHIALGITSAVAAASLFLNIYMCLARRKVHIKPTGNPVLKLWRIKIRIQPLFWYHKAQIQYALMEQGNWTIERPKIHHHLGWEGVFKYKI